MEKAPMQTHRAFVFLAEMVGFNRRRMISKDFGHAA